MGTHYEVELLQPNAALNCAVDSAIVLLLLKDKDADGSLPKGYIQSVVLIDGGNGSETADLILKTIKRIESDYRDKSKKDSLPQIDLDSMRWSSFTGI